MPRRSRPNFRRFINRRAITTVSILLVVVAASLLFYVARLDRKIVQKFEGRRWDLPAQVYARPLELYTGLRLTSKELEAELAALGYVRSDKPETQGTWNRSGSRVRLTTRPFRFWDGDQAPQQARVTFGPDGIAGVTTAAGESLPFLRLDPPFIGNIFTAHGEDRVVVLPEEVPPLLLEGLKVVEDRDFDHHSGVSFRAIARAMLANVMAGGLEQGGSTLTQQLVRSYFLTNERTLSRKVREALMSLLLEAHFAKPDILNAYVNEIYLGQAGDRAIHGFGLASQFYFGRPLAELEPQEIALLIAIVRGPSYYDPRRHPERVQARRDLVLDLMGEFQLLVPEQVAAAKAKPVGVRGTAATTFASYNPSYMDLVRRELAAAYKEEDLRTAGLRILTNLDPRIQSRAEQQLAEGIASIEKSRGKKAADTLEGAVVVTSVTTGDVVAIVGGRNNRMQGFNRALDAKRPIGSLAKPFVYLAALETGKYHTASVLEDAPLILKLDTGKTWSPENYDKLYRGPVPVVRALAESLNLPTVRVGMDVGPKKVASVFQELGLPKAPPPLPSLILGSIALSPIDVAQLYNSLANSGFKTPLRAVRAVLDADGKPLVRAELEVNRGADPAAVYQLNTALEQVVERGTGQGARRWLPPGLRVAGKTGTSDDLRDSWFAGFTNEHVAVVWVGADDNRPTGLSGASGALPIWSRIVAGFGDGPYQPVPADGYSEVWFDFATGMMADVSCGGDMVLLPLPNGVGLPVKPGCSGFPGLGGSGGFQWLRDIFN